MLPIYPLPGAIFITPADFTEKNTQNQIKEILNSKEVNLVLSDMSPNASGHHFMDHENSMRLVYSAFRFALSNLCVGGSFLCKFLTGGMESKLQNDMLKFFKAAKFIKPDASRKDSTEMYLLAKNFLGAQKIS